MLESMNNEFYFKNINVINELIQKIIDKKNDDISKDNIYLYNQLIKLKLSGKLSLSTRLCLFNIFI